MTDIVIDNTNSIFVNQSAPALSPFAGDTVFIAASGQVSNFFQFANGTRADAVAFSTDSGVGVPGNQLAVLGTVIGNIRMYSAPDFFTAASALVLGDIFLNEPGTFLNNGLIAGNVVLTGGDADNYGHVTGNVLFGRGAGINSEFHNFGQIDGLVTVDGTADDLGFTLFNGRPGGALRMHLIGENMGVTTSEFDDQIVSDLGDQDVFAAGGNDTFFNVGLVAFATTDGNDTFNGGAGTDTYDARSNEVLAGIDANLTLGRIISLELGTDTIINIENFIGSFGNDLIVGSAAANRLVGENGNDKITGLGGNDNLDGGLEEDRVQGGSGRDFVNGGGGNDTLFGGGGADTLYGGSDTLGDRMTGGSGNDTFLYLSAAESLDFGGLIDTITDFRRGRDIIDLSAIDAIAFNPTINEAFEFMGSGPLTSAGQLRIDHRADGNTYIEMSWFDATVFTVIRLVGNVALDAGDFLL